MCRNFHLFRAAHVAAGGAGARGVAVLADLTATDDAQARRVVQGVAHGLGADLKKHYVGREELSEQSNLN